MEPYMRGLYAKYGLTNGTEDANLETVAKALLSNMATKFDGAELVLGRRIDAQETNIVRLYAFSDANTAYGLLLLQKSMEQG